MKAFVSFAIKLKILKLMPKKKKYKQNMKFKMKSKMSDDRVVLCDFHGNQWRIKVD